MVRDMLLAALAMAAPADTSVRLDELLTFTDSARCVPGEAFGSIIDQLRVLRKSSPASFRLDVPERFRAAFPDGYIALRGNNGRVKVVRSVNGNWHGVGVISIALEWAPDAKEPDLELFFAAPLPVVREMLSGQGLVGPSRIARIEAERGGSLMTCQRKD